jgi:hypothetical protein
MDGDLEVMVAEIGRGELTLHEVGDFGLGHLLGDAGQAAHGTSVCGEQGQVVIVQVGGQLFPGRSGHVGLLSINRCG